jgi:tRNA-dihydrouridine synthase A
MFHRQFSRQALLYTEMVTSAAVIHGDRDRLLGFDPAEEPLALQLGGCNPAELAGAVAIARDYGYGEINLNVGCPSDRVQAGAFGAVLMERPGLVADCAAAMIRRAQGAEITVKCRIGVDDQQPEEALPAFLAAVAEAGVRRFIIHARKAWLKGLSPKENREIPPLDHALVRRMKAEFPDLHLTLNGGIATIGEAIDALSAVDGVMIGRAAYHQPADILAPADRRIFGAPGPDRSPEEAVRSMLPYIERQLEAGERLHAITRHMLGAFNGRSGARKWRQTLSEGAGRAGAGPELLEFALAAVAPLAA